MKAWIYIVIAAVIEVFWALSLKKLSMPKVIEVVSNWNIISKDGYEALFPLISYVIFGLANGYIIGLAFKEIPISVAFGAWTGLTLVFNFIVDATYFKEQFSIWHFLYLSFILIGIFGLKSLTTK